MWQDAGKSFFIKMQVNLKLGKFKIIRYIKLKYEKNKS